MRTELSWKRAAGVAGTVGLGMTMLAGCAGSGGTAIESAATGQLRLKGGVHGGQQAVVGASIQLMAAGAGGYGGSAIPLLTSAVTTDATGGFNITGEYTCPSATSQVYLLATGGNPGLPSGQTNPDLALMAGLGACGDLTASTFIAVSEVTTVATAYALAGYMTGVTQLSSSGTSLAQQGMATAFGTITRMVDLSTGLARATTPAGTAVVPAAEINTIANILSACVNSAGSGVSSGSNPCSALEGAAISGSGTVPTNTIDVLLNMAHLPGQSVSTIYNLQPAAGPFQPTLASQPSDWTMALSYGTKLPAQVIHGGLVVDGSGNVWSAGDSQDTVRVIGSDGTELSGAGGYAIPGVSGVSSLAVDLSGTVWVGGQNGKLAGVTAQGAPVSGLTGIASGYGTVNGLAIGPDNTLWATSTYNVAHLSSAGTAIGPTPAQAYSGAAGAAIDSGGNLWVANLGSESIAELAAGASSPTTFALTYQDPYAVAIGRNDEVWVAHWQTNPGAVSELSDAGAQTSASPYVGGALYAPWDVAMDGDNHAWFGLYNCRCVMAMSTGGGFVTPSTGVGSSLVRYAVGIGVDGSGDVWVENSDGRIVELVGAAAPVVTPVAYAAKNNLLGQRP